MLNCLNIEDTQKVQELLKKSGLSDFELRSQLRHYATLHEGKLPLLDELYGSNSEPYLRKLLKLPKGKSGNIKDLCKFLRIDENSSLQDAIIRLNNEYRDLEISGRQLGDTKYSLNIRKRPAIVSSISENLKILDKEVDVPNTIKTVIGKLSDLYGIPINYLSTDLIKSRVNNATLLDYNAKGFILNGEIYINMDHAGENPENTVLHEFMHMILGSVKFLNPSLYSDFISLGTNPNFLLDNFKSWLGTDGIGYGNRTLNDLLEEYMVQKMTEYLTMSDDTKLAEIALKNPEMMYQLKYNMFRILDTMFMGDYSVRSISDTLLFNFSIKDIANMVNSSILNNSFKGSFDDALINRMMGNTKQKLIEAGKLELNCQ